MCDSSKWMDKKVSTIIEIQLFKFEKKKTKKHFFSDSLKTKSIYIIVNFMSKFESGFWSINVPRTWFLIVLFISDKS